MITTWITTLITFFLGYILGVYSQSPEKIKEAQKKIKQKLSNQKLGGIQNASHLDLANRGTPLEAEEKEMTKLLNEEGIKPK